MDGLIAYGHCGFRATERVVPRAGSSMWRRERAIASRRPLCVIAVATGWDLQMPTTHKGGHHG
jgi:hypothetical protein